MTPAPRIYTSGPFTGSDDAVISGHCTVATLHAARIVEAGGYPVCPHAVGWYCRHSSRPWSWWMTQCLRELRTCDAIYMLPEWEQSSGARLELTEAQAHRMPVLYRLESVAEFVREWRSARVDDGIE